MPLLKCIAAGVFVVTVVFLLCCFANGIKHFLLHRRIERAKIHRVTLNDLILDDLEQGGEKDKQERENENENENETENEKDVMSANTSVSSFFPNTTP